MARRLPARHVGAGAVLAGASPSKNRDRAGVTGAQAPRHQPGAPTFRFNRMLGGPGQHWDSSEPSAASRPFETQQLRDSALPHLFRSRWLDRFRCQFNADAHSQPIGAVIRR